jgi:hypothetical protein
MSPDREKKPTPAEVSQGLREQAFLVEPAQVSAKGSPENPQTWGLIMETGYPKAVASLVAFCDGTTSMYFSSGGGVIGAGQHAAVREASKALLASADACLEDFAPATAHPLPGAGRVRFYARTFDGLKFAEAEEKELGEGRHRLSPLFHAGHRVIAHLRQISERKAQR